jgi:hypothetical protein
MTAPTILPGTVQPAPAGAHGVDTNTTITSARVAELKLNPSTANATFIARYVSRSTTEASGDLSHNEALLILQSGYALVVLQHPDSNPTAALGTSDGKAAAANAKAIGVPTGIVDPTFTETMEIFLDIELPAGNTVSASTLKSYCINWAKAVFAAGYAPALYFGAGTRLSSSDLSDLQSYFVRFWQAFNVTNAPSRGYAMVQNPGQPQNQQVNPLTDPSFTVDFDTTQKDVVNNTPTWLSPNITG